MGRNEQHELVELQMPSAARGRIILQFNINSGLRVKIQGAVPRLYPLSNIVFEAVSDRYNNMSTDELEAGGPSGGWRGGLKMQSSSRQLPVLLASQPPMSLPATHTTVQNDICCNATLISDLEVKACVLQSNVDDVLSNEPGVPVDAGTHTADVKVEIPDMGLPSGNERIERACCTPTAYRMDASIVPRTATSTDNFSRASSLCLLKLRRRNLDNGGLAEQMRFHSPPAGSMSACLHEFDVVLEPTHPPNSLRACYLEKKGQSLQPGKHLFRGSSACGDCVGTKKRKSFLNGDCIGNSNLARSRSAPVNAVMGRTLGGQVIVEMLDSNDFTESPGVDTAHHSKDDLLLQNGKNEHTWGASDHELDSVVTGAFPPEVLSMLSAFENDEPDAMECVKGQPLEQYWPVLCCSSPEDNPSSFMLSDGGVLRFSGVCLARAPGSCTVISGATSPLKTSCVRDRPCESQICALDGASILSEDVPRQAHLADGVPDSGNQSPTHRLARFGGKHGPAINTRQVGAAENDVAELERTTPLKRERESSEESEGGGSDLLTDGHCSLIRCPRCGLSELQTRQWRRNKGAGFTIMEWDASTAQYTSVHYAFLCNKDGEMYRKRLIKNTKAIPDDNTAGLSHSVLAAMATPLQVLPGKRVITIPKTGELEIVDQSDPRAPLPGVAPSSKWALSTIEF
jgi:hypothetical protein